MAEREIPADEYRCTFRRPSDGARCIKQRVLKDRCKRHAGGSKELRAAKIMQANIELRMANFVEPIAADDPEADPITAFEVEYRRTLGRIRWLDQKIATLRVSDLGWGLRSETTKEATEFPGTDTEYATAINIYVQIQQWERKHLLDMQKVWIGAKLDVAKLRIQAAHVEVLDTAITKILRRLGQKPDDPDVRAVVFQELSALPVQTVSARVLTQGEDY